MTDNEPLLMMKESAIRLRQIADRQEAMLQLETFTLPEHHANFVKASAALVRAAASALDRSIDIHLQICELMGSPQEKLKPRLTVVSSETKPPAA